MRDHDHGDEAHVQRRRRLQNPLRCAAGRRTLFPNSEDERERGIGFAAVTDGLSNTIMAIEAPEDKAVIWTRPDDWELDLDEPSAGLFSESRLSVLMGDGSVRSLRAGIEEECSMRCLLAPAARSLAATPSAAAREDAAKLTARCRCRARGPPCRRGAFPRRGLG